MRLLGAILAGGRSRRFGSDKALALLEGRTLLDHVLDRLRPQVDEVIVCGRSVDGLTGVADHPAPDLGPLGGIAGALRHAAKNGFDAVVTVPCDAPLLPDDLVTRLIGAGFPASAAELPIIGLWPSSLAATIDAYLDTAIDRSLRRWCAHVGAARPSFGDIANINSEADLRAIVAAR